MSAPRQKYWFRAKRYGWGWGLPTCWQGWLVLTAYVGFFALGAILLPGDAHGAERIVCISVITAGLLLVCWKKGEPPRWRWGGD